MAPIRRNALRALGLGTALAVLTAFACLALSGWLTLDSFGSPTLTLAGLAKSSHAESVLMSCADDNAPSGGDAMLWCSDPSAPHCIPAAPEVPRPEVWDRPDSSLVAGLTVPVASFVLLPWPRPELASLYARDNVSRLERPPRV
jgi:hypothetical protein